MATRTRETELTTTTNNTSSGTTVTTTSQATTDRSSSTSESRKKPEYEIGAIIDGKWKVLSELGRGGCGVVYCVERINLKDSTSHPKAALKAEYVLKHYSETLAAEANILRKLQWSRHVCQLFACGRISEDINIVCMSLAGPSLSYLRRNSPQQRMTFSSALRLAFHCLNAVEDLHCIGYLHRDVKASNFAIGYYASEARTIRILDFGFARSYLSWDETKTFLRHRKPRPRAPFLGTDRYCSPNVHKRIEQGRRDDCWSWLFMLVELMYGKLPWRDASTKDVCQVKEDSLPKLFRHGPVEMYAALDHLQSLHYESRPNYDHLRDIITKICRDRGFNFSDPYDWEAGGAFYEAFEQLKDASFTTTSTRTSATGTTASPLSQDPEMFKKPQNEESFVEMLDKQPSPPAENFATSAAINILPATPAVSTAVVADAAKKKGRPPGAPLQKDDEEFHDAKDDTRRN